MPSWRHPKGDGVEELEVRLGVHDTSRLEWVAEVPLPARGDAPLSVQLQAEIPASVWSPHDSFERLQLLARLATPATLGPVRTPASVDDVRRAALAAEQRLKTARHRIEQDLATAASLFATTSRRHVAEDVLAAVETALAELESARRELCEAGEREPPELARERGLAAEFLSHSVLAFLSRVQAAADERLGSGRHRSAQAGALAQIHGGVARSLAAELSFREARGLVRPTDGDPAALERYVERAGLLKKHFQELFFLRADTETADRRFRNWFGVAAAMLAALWAFPLGLILTTGAGVAGLSLGFLWVALLFAVMYAVKDRIKESVRLWLSARIVSGLGARFTTLRTARRGERVVRLRESFVVSRERRADPLNPAAGATRPVVVLRYRARGELAAARTADGASRLRLVFRYDLSPLFSRLDDPVRRVPVLAEDGRAVRFAPAPRAYRIPVELRVRYRHGEAVEAGVLVAQKLGLERIEAAALAAPAAELSTT